MRATRECFGSTAKGTARPDSDIDFLVDLGSGRTLFDVAALHDDLESLRDVDVLTPTFGQRSPPTCCRRGSADTRHFEDRLNDILSAINEGAELVKRCHAFLPPRWLSARRTIRRFPQGRFQVRRIPWTHERNALKGRRHECRNQWRLGRRQRRGAPSRVTECYESYRYRYRLGSQADDHPTPSNWPLPRRNDEGDLS